MWVPPTTGELYYLRMMLTITKGPTSYEDIKLVNGFQYLTYREACFAMGFLGDDREYIAAIREAYNWGSRSILEKVIYNHALIRINGQTKLCLGKKLAMVMRQHTIQTKTDKSKPRL
jgi:hypothetical protein